MSMWKFVGLNHKAPRAASGAPRIAGCLVALGLLAWMSFLPSAAVGRGDISGVLRVRGILIACYHQGSNRYTAAAKPARCDFVGQERGGKKSISSLIQGVRWSEWGEYKSEGSYGTDVRTGARVRLWASDRVRCADGRTFYKRINITDLSDGSYSVTWLPTCGVAVQGS